MKTLYIARHGKSSWEKAGISDDKRPLLFSGEENTKLVGIYLAKKKIKPNMILSSFAKRAKDTAIILASEIGFPVENIIITKDLYYADESSIYDLFFEISDKINTLMLVGHNPTLTYFANNFTDEKLDNLPTSGIVAVSLAIKKWQDISKCTSKELFRVFPKHLKKD